MSRRRDDDEDLDSALGGVRPLADRGKLRPRPAPGSRAPAQPPPAPTFVREERDGFWFIRREDVSRRRLAELRAGRIAVDREIDLHGLDARQAQRTLLAALADAQRAGARCVLVIHGAGHHSEGLPVLRAALPGWLLEGPLAGEILAFAGAPPALGGHGASLVLLRRAR